MKEKEANKVSEYLILLKLNPGKIINTLDSLRKLSSASLNGVDLCYSINIFGGWEVGLWITAEDSIQVLEFVQKKAKNMAGLSEVYTVPTFPHGNELQKAEDEKKTPKAVNP